MIPDRRALVAVPLLIAVLAGVAFWVMLDRMQEGSFDPRGVPSVLTGKHVPGFTLPGIGPVGASAGAAAASGFGSVELSGAGQPVLVNFWASWCPPCIEEHPLLMELKRQGVPIWGIAYKDSAANAAQFLKRHGDPFMRSARDDPGRVAIDWGLTGVPETFLVDSEGVVRWHMAGPLTRAIIDRQLLPAMRRLKAAAPSS